MRDRADEWRSYRSIDDLAAASPRKMFALSPNDALVQVALPLVLILAIVVRLLVIGQTVGTASSGLVILEMWKQQLILRIDQVISEWESDSQLPTFPDADRIRWGHGLPDDPRFQQLAQKTEALNDLGQLSEQLYWRALRYRPETEGSELDHDHPLAYILELYDPEAPFAPEGIESIPPEFVITPERRQFALNYIGDRLLKAREQVEALQWSVVARAAASLPLEGEIDESQAAAQLRLITHELEERGYPVLQRVKREYEAP